MRIEPASTASGIGCRVSSDCFPATVTIDGLHPAELAWLFGFAKAPSFDWAKLRARGAITVALEADSKEEPGARLNIDLEDGQVSTASDGPAQLRVDRQHFLHPTLFPKSLNLCLAQQWARAGILVVHGAGIALEECGTLILGKKASGKSTLAAAALVAGGKVVSDDWMLLGLGPNNQPYMERLRQFMMLRHSASTSDILAKAPELPFRVSTERPKSTLALSPTNDQFPGWHRVHQLWIMKRANPRPTRSQSQTVAPSAGLSALISGSMPILFGQDFHAEHQRLQYTLLHCLGLLRTSEAISGLDVTEEARRALKLLHSAGIGTGIESYRID